MERPWSVALLLTIHAALVGWIGWGACPNKTELGHMGAAVYFWHTLRFDVYNVNPPLTRVISGLPVLLCAPKCDWACYSSRPQDRSEWAIGCAFVGANSSQKVHWCFALARWSLIPLLLLGGYFGYRLSRDIYGKPASFVFLVLWCFSPLLLAWGATVCPDAVAAALGLVAVYALRQWLCKPNWRRAAIAGVCLGLLPLTKLTWIIAFALWMVIWWAWAAPIYVKRTDKRCLPIPYFRQFAAILFIALYTLNMGYLFDGTFCPLGRYGFRSQLLRGREMPDKQHTLTASNRFAGIWLGVLPVPLPVEFVRGIDTQRYDFEQGLPSYLRGEWAGQGWWYYYLYALAVKEPLGTWCLAALATAATVFGWGYSASWRDELLVLAPGLAIVTVVSSQVGFSAHSRYVIPALPFIYVWVSKVAAVFDTHPLTAKRLVMAAGILLVLAWSVGSSMVVYPYSLSYFNELAAVLATAADASYPTPIGGNPKERAILFAMNSAIRIGPLNGPRHLLGSNIDWGQDLFCLEDWYELHPEARPIKVAYFGGYPLERSKVKSAGFPPIGPSEKLIDKVDPATLGPLPGWYAVSVNFIYSRDRGYRYFLHFRPVAMAGYSIYIYHITLHEANGVRHELGLPELPLRDCREPGGVMESSADSVPRNNSDRVPLRVAIFGVGNRSAHAMNNLRVILDSQTGVELGVAGRGRHPSERIGSI